MIEIINDIRKVNVVILGSFKTITMRIKLKGTSFNERQEDLRNIYNSHLLRTTKMIYSVRIHSRALEIIATKDGISKSLGFISEEIVKTIWNFDTILPTIDGVEVRKHMTDHPFFGATVRITTSIPSTMYLNVVKEMELNILKGKEDIYGSESTGTGPTENRSANAGDDGHTEDAANRGENK